LKKSYSRFNPGSSPKNMLWSCQDLPGGSAADRVGRDAVKVEKTTTNMTYWVNRQRHRVTHPTKKGAPRVLGT
jgi:hypothetical protein